MTGITQAFVIALIHVAYHSHHSKEELEAEREREREREREGEEASDGTCLPWASVSKARPGQQR